MGTVVDTYVSSLGRNFNFDYANACKSAALALFQQCHQDYPQPEDVTTGMTYIPVDLLMMRPFRMSYYCAEQKAREDIARIARSVRREVNVENRAPVLV